MRSAVSSESLDQIFRSARTYNGWTDTPVEVGLVRDLYDLLKWGPTSANSNPARFVWVHSAEGKTKLAGLAAEIIGNNVGFADAHPKLMPHNVEAMQKAFAAPGVSEVTAMRNGSLQGAYLIVAARALGLDCGPMSGFDNAGVDKAFFAGTRIQSNFICSIGSETPIQYFRAIRGFLLRKLGISLNDGN
jgi:3-hydroxypropanoate dehydrogenase